MSFKIGNHDCEFSRPTSRDALRFTAVSTGFEGGDALKTADAFDAIATIALKYLKVDGKDVLDDAGAEIALADADEPFYLTIVVTEFVKYFEPFTKSLNK